MDNLTHVLVCVFKNCDDYKDGKCYYTPGFCKFDLEEIKAELILKNLKNIKEIE